MNAPEKMVRVLDGVRYSTTTGELLADNTWWDGHNFERSGRNTFLYRGKSGRYFFAHRTQWQGERDSLVPCSEQDAMEFFSNVPEDCQYFELEEAFPDAAVEEA